MDCFAEPVIGRAFARPVGSQWRSCISGAAKQRDGQITQKSVQPFAQKHSA